MNRRAFLKRFAVLAGAAILGPKTLYEAIKTPIKQVVPFKTQDAAAQQLAADIDKDILKSAFRSGRMGIVDRFIVYKRG